MRCSKARETIVLEVSGDAAATDCRQLARHLERCHDCRRFANGAALPLAALRTPVPLRDADYAAIRARVRAELAQRREPRRFWLPLPLAATLILVVAIGGALFFSRNRSVAPQTRQSHVAPSMVTEPSPAPEVFADLAREPEPPADPPARPPIRRHRPHHDPATALVHQPLQPEMRIQIQTADPDIRIIWIANPTYPTQADTLKETSS